MPHMMIPKVAFTIISPNISVPDGSTSHQSAINKRLAQRVSQKILLKFINNLI